MTERRLVVWVLTSAGLMVIGAFGPWVNAIGLNVSGTDSSKDGRVVIGAAVLGSALFFVMRTARRAGVWALAAGLIGAAATLYDRNDINDVIGEDEQFAFVVQIGWGLNLAMVASISLAGAGLAWLLVRRPAQVAAPPPSPDAPAT